MSRRVLMSVVACGLLATSCGGEAARQLPSAGAVALPVAEPTPLTGGAVVAPSDREPDAPSAPPQVAESESVAVVSPSEPAMPARPGLSDIADFVATHRIDGAPTVEHVVLDVDDDEVSEVVFTAVADGRAVVEIAWWGTDGYRVLSTGRGGAGRSVTSLQVFDLTLDRNPEVVVEVAAGSRASLSLWSVRGRGVLLPLQANGGCHDGSHVYGAVGARIVFPGGAVPGVMVASCDDSPLPVRDWSEQRWTWRDGAFHVVPGSIAPVPDAQQQRRTDDESDDADNDATKREASEDDGKSDKKDKSRDKSNGNSKGKVADDGDRDDDDDDDDRDDDDRDDDDDAPGRASE